MARVKRGKIRTNFSHECAEIATPGSGTRLYWHVHHGVVISVGPVISGEIFLNSILLSFETHIFFEGLCSIKIFTIFDKYGSTAEV